MGPIFPVERSHGDHLILCLFLKFLQNLKLSKSCFCLSRAKKYRERIGILKHELISPNSQVFLDLGKIV
ncbi:MAG: hypothetical protein CV087_10310 [Candidatus Brocadia sp. WS118]|nr:MAG: hypothetical protein CV087_10310 [Candidatus Brocadia sp. WS118]